MSSDTDLMDDSVPSATLLWLDRGDIGADVFMLVRRWRNNTMETYKRARGGLDVIFPGSLLMCLEISRKGGWGC